MPAFLSLPPHPPIISYFQNVPGSLSLWACVHTDPSGANTLSASLVAQIPQALRCWSQDLFYLLFLLPFFILHLQWDVAAHGQEPAVCLSVHCASPASPVAGAVLESHRYLLSEHIV